MKNKGLLFFMIMVLLCTTGILFAQTVHQVSAGDETLKDAIAAAADGDILELVDSGGVYTTSSSGSNKIEKTLTIRAAEGLAERPVVRNIKLDESSVRIFEIYPGGNLTLIGLDIDGAAEDGGAAHAKNIIRSRDVSAEADTFHFYLKVDDCILHNTKEATVKLHQWTIADSVVFTNTIIDESVKEGILTTEGSSKGGADVKMMEFTNCTFTKIGREAIYIDWFNPVVRINHCTFDSVSYLENKRVIYPKNVTDVIVKNSIFSNQGGTQGSCIDLYGSSVMEYCDIWMADSADVNDTAVLGDGMLYVDPMYTDPANNDYTLMDTSPVLGIADDGYAYGDLRWDPNAAMGAVIKVEAGANTLSDALDNANDGDTIELVTDGGLYTDTEGGSIKIEKNITIRAAENLLQKPVIRNTDLSQSSVRVFEIYPGGGLHLMGVIIDGSADDTGVAHAKNVIRSRDVAEADSFTFELEISDCEFRNTKEAMIKLHQFTSIDSLIISNSLFDESVKEGVLTTEGSSKGGADVKYIELYNCTFTKIGREALYIDWFNPVVRINHCTFDSVSYLENKRVIYPKNVTDVIVKNSIFSNQGGTQGSTIDLYGNSVIEYCDIWQADSADVNDSAVIGDGMLYVDPIYADPANNDYRLASESPVRGMADDGFAMGDLRWEADPGLVSLVVNIVGKGSVALDPPGGWYQPGTSVTITATADANYGFTGWEGITVFPPDNPVATVTVDANTIVTATFESLLPKHTLTIYTLGLGSFTVDPLPNENGQYEEGTLVTLTATPQENWEFVEWIGDVTGSDNPITVSIDSNITVTGSFQSIFTQFALDITVVGEGSVVVDPEPVIATYDTNTVVTLTAEPVLGWEFVGWTGDLESAAVSDSVVMDMDKAVTATFQEIEFANHSLEIDSTWDLRDAVEFANNNSNIDSLILTTPGLYTSTQTADVAVMKPLTIVAKDGLDSKPVITNSDVEKSNDDVFRVFDDFTLEGVVLDGGHAMTHGPKYGIRLRHYSNDTVKTGTNITVNNCDFVNFFEDKDLNKDGHCFKIDVDVAAGVVKFENTTFNGAGYEALRISDTEKWATDRALDSLIVRNCTFTNIDAECIRYYSDVDPATPDAPVIVEHVTVNNSATRIMYLKNSGGAVVKDIIIANSRQSGHGRDDDLMDAQGNVDIPSFVSHIDTFNVKAVAIKSADGEVDTTTIWGIDPMFADAEAMDYTLLPASHLYGLASDGEALGDLNWATNEPTHVALAITVEGEGTVALDPAPVGKTYDPGAVVTMTAVADSGFRFLSWSGAVTGSNNPVQITLDESKAVTATFEEIPTGIDENALPTAYELSQNYPNPFNPSTTINFALKAPGYTTVKVYDTLGREVMTLVDRKMEAGRYHVEFHNVSLASGVYFYKIQSGSFNAIKKMILVK